MDANKRIEALEAQVTALQDQMSIVLLMLAQPAPEPAPQSVPVQEAEPQAINFKDINFPI
jgi:hypothetical protein